MRKLLIPVLLFFAVAAYPIRTNNGNAIYAACLFGASSGQSCAAGTYLALSTDTTTPAATDTSCASEQTTNGLARKSMTITYPYTNGDNVPATLGAATFTYTGSSTTTITKLCVFTASSGGVMTNEVLIPGYSFTTSGQAETFQYVWNQN